MNVNTPIDYSSRYSFGHFCCRVKQGKRLSEFLQKYTDSGTKTTNLAGYKNLCGPASTFHRKTLCQFVMLYLVWDREINISLFFSDVLYENEAPGLEQAAVVTMATSTATFKKGFFLPPPRAGWRFSFPKMFDSFRDMFLTTLLLLYYFFHSAVCENSWMPLCTVDLNSEILLKSMNGPYKVPFRET